MLYVTGNTHGDLSRFNNSIMKKFTKDDVLFVCGDFGFLWDDSENEKKALKKLSQKKYTIAFVDGTHENFDLLSSYPMEEYCGGKIRRIAPNIVYLMRGEIFTIQGKSILAFGGGESDAVDKAIRKKSKSWWVQELPEKECIEYAKKNLENVSNRVDYIITHEPPISSRIATFGDIRELNYFDIFLDDITKTVRYKKWFFGSLHLDRKISAKSYSVFTSIVFLDNVVKRPWWQFWKR